MLSRERKIVYTIVIILLLIVITKYFAGDVKSLIIIPLVAFFISLPILVYIHKAKSEKMTFNMADFLVIVSFLITIVVIKLMSIKFQLVIFHVSAYVVMYCIFKANKNINNAFDVKNLAKPLISDADPDPITLDKVYKYKQWPFMFNAILISLFIVPLDIIIVKIAIGSNDVIIKSFMWFFAIIALAPIYKIIYTSYQKIQINNNGISVIGLFNTKYIKWDDILKVQNKSILSSFTESRFDKPKDLLIYSKNNKKISIVSYIDSYDEILKILRYKKLINN